jgi:hypothetical protein
LLGLPGGGLAAGTDADTVDLWVAPEAVQRGGAAPKKLQASDGVTTLVGVPGSGLAAGTQEVTVDLWADAEAVLRGGAAPTKLQTSDSVTALLGLPGGGLAAGTYASLSIDWWSMLEFFWRGGAALTPWHTSNNVSVALRLPAGNISGLIVSTTECGDGDVAVGATSGDLAILRRGPGVVGLMSVLSLKASGLVLSLACIGS